MLYRITDGLPLVLASASPRRREMLARVGLGFIPAKAEVDESLLPGEEAEDAVVRLADLKARAVAGEHPGAATLAADTLVALGSRILGKPKDESEASEMLAALSGQEHRVVTGFCLLHRGRASAGRAISRVRFRELSPAEIEAYVRSGEPLDKAGAYAVQGLGAALVEEVRGSYTNVVGLPLAAIIKLLMSKGMIEPNGVS